MKTNVTATLLAVPILTLKYLDNECRTVQAKHGFRLRRVGICRAVVNGLAAAKFSLAPFRSEFELQDFICDAVSAAKARNEVGLG